MVRGPLMVGDRRSAKRRITTAFGLRKTNKELGWSPPLSPPSTTAPTDLLDKFSHNGTLSNSPDLETKW